MEIFVVILLFVLTVLVSICITQFVNLKGEVLTISKSISNMYVNLEIYNKDIVVLGNNVNRINKNIEGFNSPISTIAKFGADIIDIKETVYKNQTALTVTKNIVEEIRNHIKASKPSKNNKVNKTSTKQKSVNSEALTGSQTANSANK